MPPRGGIRQRYAEDLKTEEEGQGVANPKPKPPGTRAGIRQRAAADAAKAEIEMEVANDLARNGPSG